MTTTRSRSTSYKVLPALFVLLARACTASDQADPQDAAPSAARQWTFSAEPDLRIGVAEGDPSYEFHKLVSAVTLPDSGVAVLNAGSHELRFYDAAGRFVRSIGAQGGGPGEFQNPVRLYLFHDTLAIFDHGASRLSLHRVDGEFITTRPLVRQTGTLQWDEWLYDMSWIDGPALGRGKTAVKRAVERLPLPDTSEGYRYVRVTPHGHLWVRQPAASNAVNRVWHVHDLTGAQIAQVQIPINLELLETGADHVLARARDSLGVEYLQRHRLQTDLSSMAPHAFADESPIQTSSVDSTAVRELRVALRMLNGAQEVYYSDPASNYKYADDHQKLRDYQPPEGVEVRIVFGHTTGWTAVAMHRPTKTMCGMAIGTTPPVGWLPGRVMCM